MNPDVVQAIPQMVRSGILEQEKSNRLLRIAKGELISVRAEIQLLFYLGVLLTASGAGLLIKDNYDRIGPVAVALAVGAGALFSFMWAARKAPAFSWSEVPSPSLSYDYLLLLGVLLGAADLAFIEVQFTPLGKNWPWHLLITSLLIAWIAVRFDSRTIFSLALSTFAAWRGVSVSLIEKPIWSVSTEPIRWNAIGCGIFFIFIGRYLLQSRRKSHFESIAVYLGWLLVLGAFVSGGAENGTEGTVYILMLVAAGGFLAWYYFQKRNFVLFAAGVLAIFIAYGELLTKFDLGYGLDAFIIKALMFSAAAIGLVVLLWKTHRKMKEPL